MLTSNFLAALAGRRAVGFLAALPLREFVAGLVSMYRAILNLRPVLFPLATRLLSSADQSEMARKMAERRTPAAFLTRPTAPRFGLECVPGSFATLAR